MKNLVMVLKVEAVTDAGIETLRDEEDMEAVAKAVNAYPKLIAELKRLCVEIPSQLGARPMSNDLLRELGE